MPKPTKILLISLSAGSGHKQAAKALEKTIQLHYPHVTCRHIDMAEFITPLLKTTAVSGYGFLVSHLPRVWKSLFKLTDSKRIIAAYRKLTDYLKKLNSFDFLHEVEAFEPDHIICTHFLPAEILIHAQKKQLRKVPITQVITDYGVHPAWVIEGIRTYVVASDAMKDQLIHDFHVDADTIQTFGIPIDPEFESIYEPETLKSSYGLSPKNPLILVLSGGGGLIDISIVLKELFVRMTNTVNIIAVAGNNEKLFTEIQHLPHPVHITYRAFGWTDHIPQMMNMADVVISKPGGLTVTECMSLGVPLIAINPIPGQEDFNIEHIVKKKMGSYAKKNKDIYPLLTHYLSKDYIKKDREYSQSSRKIIEFLTTE